MVFKKGQKFEKMKKAEQEKKSKPIMPGTEPAIHIEQKPVETLTPELKKAAEGVPPTTDLAKDPVVAIAMAKAGITRGDLKSAYVFLDKVVLVTVSKGKITIAR